MQYFSLFLLFISGSILTIGDIVMKKWIEGNDQFGFIGGLSIYLAGLLFLVWSYKYTNIAIASTISEIFNIVILLIVSYLYFHETINMYQFIGIVLGIFAIIFFQIGESA